MSARRATIPGRRALESLGWDGLTMAAAAFVTGVLLVLSGWVVVASLRTPVDGLQVNRGTSILGPGGQLEVVEGSAHGVAPGDVIVAVDGRPPADWMGDLGWLTAVVPPGHTDRLVTYELAPRGQGQAARTVRLPLHTPPPSEFLRQWPAVLYGTWQFVLGVVVFVRRPRSRAARAMLVGGAGVLLWMAGSMAGVSASDLALRTGLLRWALAGLGFTLAWGALLHFALIFPRTHPWLRGHERLAWCAYAVPLVLRAATFVVASLRADSAGERVAAWANVSTVEQWLLPMLVVAALVHHHVTGDRDVRARAGLVVLAAGEGLAGYVLLTLLPLATSGHSLVSTELQPLLVLPLPLAQTVAVLRRRLLDIDVIVNRSLVWGALTLGVVGIYVAGVWVLGGIVSGARPQWATLGITAFVAIAFQPGRDLVQRTVDRFMYGHRSEPYRVLAALSREIGATPGPADVLPRAVEGIAQALRLPWVSVELRGDNAIAWPTDAAPALPVWRCPLVHQGTLVGNLAVASRDSHGLGGNDQKVLEDLAAQLAVAAHAVQLARALQRSRERLVAAREEERHHLHHDLHDGVGPTLAGVALKLELTLERLTPDQADIHAVLTQMLTETQDAVRDVRRIVYGLRPPAVLELGLGAALEQRARSFQGPGGSQRVRFTVAAGELPELAPAVMVAAYRIAVEAMTNVIRHARAEQCLVEVRCLARGSRHGGRTLLVRVSDDGVGLGGPLLPGVGVSSMIERAAEIGGWCRVGRSLELAPGEPAVLGGAMVLAELPLGEGLWTPPGTPPHGTAVVEGLDASADLPASADASAPIPDHASSGSPAPIPGPASSDRPFVPGA